MKYKITSNTKNVLQIRSYKKGFETFNLLSGKSKTLDEKAYEAYKEDIEVYGSKSSGRLLVEKVSGKKSHRGENGEDSDKGETQNKRVAPPELKAKRKEKKALQEQLKAMPKEHKVERKKLQIAIKKLNAEIKELTV